jgi:hypothetical protein
MEEAFYSGILVIISSVFYTRIISQGFIFREPFLSPGAVSPVLLSLLPEASNPAAWLVAPDGRYEFPLTLMGVLALESVHARPSAQPPINMSRNLLALMSAKSPSNISPNPSTHPCIVLLFFTYMNNNIQFSIFHRLRFLRDDLES